MAWVAVGAAAVGAIGGAYSSSQASKAAASQQQAAIEAAKMDPRLLAILHGDGTDANKGLLAQYQALGNQSQSAGLQAYGQGQDAYIGANGMQDMAALRAAANGLMGSNIAAPQAQAASAQVYTNGAAAQSQGQFGAPVQWNTGVGYSAPGQAAAAVVNLPDDIQAAMAEAARVNAPGQNNTNLVGAYDRIINGNAAANPYLTSALQSGVGQTNASYQQNQTNATDNLMRNVLPGVRSNAILTGQYGGSRQGIAEGNAIGDFAKAQSNANLQLGLANSANTTGQQAASFNQGQDRALSATQGLSAQQYGVAGQNAANQQQTNLANQAAINQALQTNYQGKLTGAMANASNQQQTSMQHYQGLLSAASGTAGNMQQANLANQQAGNQGAQFNANQMLQNSQFNANMQQQNNLANVNFQNNGAQFNAGLQQQAGLSNAGFQGQTNQLNSSNRVAGIGAGGGLLGTALSGAQNQDRYAMDRASQMNGLLQPYLTGGGSAPVQPMYSGSTAGGLLGGAAAGLGLYNQFNQASKPQGSGYVGGNSYYADNDFFTS